MSAILESKGWAVALGAIMSYLVWDLPMRLGSIEEGSIYFFTLHVGLPAAQRFGDDAARALVLAFIVIARSLPVLIALSLIAAYVMRLIKYPRIFLYVMPLWPCLLHMLSLRFFFGPGRGLGNDPVDWLWLLRYNDTQGSAAIFILFFVLTYLLYLAGELLAGRRRGHA